MNLLLLVNAPHYVRPYVAVVQRLADRGHCIVIAWYEETAHGRESIEERFAAYPTVQFATVPSVRSVRRNEVALIRRAWNYLRYLDEPYRGAAKLRRRAFSKLIRLLGGERSALDPAWSDGALALTAGDVRQLKEMFAYVETLIPPDPAFVAFLREYGFDAMLVTPLVDLSSAAEADVAKAAIALGIPVGMLVYSWDNLSTKGGIHVMPDRVFVWNRQQREEALKLHRVPLDRIVITGAPRFDEFLACATRVPRDQFLEAVGLRPEKPVVMYVCSSAFVSGDELPFIERWLAQLRGAAAPNVRECNVIVRPHPDVALLTSDVPAIKTEFMFDGSPAVARKPFRDANAVVVSTAGITPQGLYECLSHSDVVVGLNTSAEIEAGLLGKPVLSILAGDAADGQETTLHFHYLLREQGGFVDVAKSLPQHVEQLQALLDAPEDVRKATRRSVLKRAMNFVRPHGMDVAVSGVLADAIEREFSVLLLPTDATQDAKA